MAMLPSSKWRPRQSAHRLARVKSVEFWVRMKGEPVQRESNFSKLPALKINQILSQGMATQSSWQTVNSLWWEAKMGWKKKILREENILMRAPVVRRWEVSYHWECISWLFSPELGHWTNLRGENPTVICSLGTGMSSVSGHNHIFVNKEKKTH